MLAAVVYSRPTMNLAILAILAGEHVFVRGLSVGDGRLSRTCLGGGNRWESLVDRRGVEPLTSAVQILTSSLH